MTQEIFEMLSDIMYAYKIILRIVLLVFIWKIFYPMKFRESILQIWKMKDFSRVLFVNLLYWNFHSLSFLISNSVYQHFVNEMMKIHPIESISDMSLMYQNTAIGMVLMFFIYTVLLLAMIFGLKRVVVKTFSMNWIEFVFLSVLNMVGWMFGQMVSKIMVVKIDTEVFLLFDEKTELLWWIPLMAILLYLGEITVIYSYQKYVEKQQERELLFIENQQIKVMKQRLEDVEGFYSNIRKVRHEMRNHMTNIKGLVLSEQYEEVESYIHELDDSIKALEYKYSTGNAVMDVLINDKWRQAEKLCIQFDVDFPYSSTISAYDMAIVLNNLLDNAIEACEKIELEKRYIRLHLKRKKRFVLVEVENSFDGIWKWENGFPVTTKYTDGFMEHGIGLKNVKDVANRYFGDLDIKVNENIFKVTVLLQEKEEK